MENFNGFNISDFTFFMDMPLEYKKVIKKKMDIFGQALYSSLNDQVRTSFKNNKMASIKEELPFARYSIGKAYGDRTRFQLCGLEITINVNRLSFSAVVRGGSFRDDKPVGKVYQKISAETEQFMKLLLSYGKDYSLTIFRRVPAKGNKIKPGSEKRLPISIFNLGLVNFEMVEYILAILEQDKLPGIQLAYGISPGHKLLQKPGDLIEKGTKIIEKEYDFLKYVES